MKRTTTSTASLAVLTAAALLAGCSASADQLGQNTPATGAGATTDGGEVVGGANATDPVSLGAEVWPSAAAVEGAVAVELGAGERFVAVTPAGDSIVTAIDRRFAEETSTWVREICVRTGEEFAVDYCHDTGAPGAGALEAQWNPSGDRLFFFEQHARKQGEMWLLDLRDSELAPLALDGVPVEASPTTFTWVDDDTLAYAWKEADDLELHALEVTTGETDLVAELGEGSAVTLTATDSGIMLLGVVDGVRGLHELDRASGEIELLRRLVRDYDVQSIDPVGRAVIVQYFDSHHPPPPELLPWDGGSGDYLPSVDADRFIYYHSFSPDFEHLAIMAIGGDDIAELAIRTADGDFTLVGSLAYERTASSFLYEDLHFTERGLVLPISGDEENGQVVLLPLTIGQLQHQPES